MNISFRVWVFIILVVEKDNTKETSTNFIELFYRMKLFGAECIL